MSPVLDLQGFLARERLDVLDVVRGAAPGTRRLVVGEADTTRATNVVALAAEPRGYAAVEVEVRCLRELDRRLRPAMRATVPSVVDEITIGDSAGAVLSAVPGITTQRPVRAHGSVRQSADAVLGWLTMLWKDTAGPSEPVDLGREAYGGLMSSFAGTPAAAATLGSVRRSRSMLSATATARTASHGCLCPRHVRISDGRVVGVDDWGLARCAADPLRDLGAWVVATAGPRIDAVFAEQTRTGRTLRDLIAEGLGHLGISPALWPDVLVLSLAEAAVAGLAQDDSTALDLLAGISRELPRTDDGKGLEP